MNRNVLIVMAGGFMIAILVALLIQSTLSGNKKQAVVATPTEPQVEIIVAAKDLKAGTELKEGDMRWQSWPKSGVFPGAVVREKDKSASEMLNGTLRESLAAGDPISSNAVIAGDKKMMATIITPGMRAVSIDVKPSGMVAGFVGPGDYVDILLSYEYDVEIPDGAENDSLKVFVSKLVDEKVVETVLENVKVLAVDQMYQRGDKTAQIGKTVTLEVDKKGAETLALAGMLGNLSLSLRRLGDDKVVGQQYPIVTDARVTNISEDVYTELLRAGIYNHKNNASQMSSFVRIYSGGTVTNIPVNQ